MRICVPNLVSAITYQTFEDELLYRYYYKPLSNIAELPSLNCKTKPTK